MTIPILPIYVHILHIKHVVHECPLLAIQPCQQRPAARKAQNYVNGDNA